MQKVSVGDVDLNVFDQGSGRPLLFVHGFPLDHTMWGDQLEWFSRTHRVLAPDLRGFGQSQVTPGAVENRFALNPPKKDASGRHTRRDQNKPPFRWAVTMDRFADDLNALLDALKIDEPVSLCGLSMGGYIAWSFLRSYPARLRSLTLCDTRAKPDTPEGVRNRMKMAEMVLENGPAPVAEAMLAKLFSKNTQEYRPEVIERVRRMIVGAGPEAIAAALHGMAGRADATALLSQTRVPTLVIVGVEDQLSPRDEMRRVAELIRGAEFTEIADAGHMAPMEQPQAFNEALARFLESVES